MEIVDRYIYAVTQKLPPSQREDIAAELRGLIEDMLEERVGAGEVTEEDIEQVLVELGSPRKMAQQYRGTKRYLIGPELYDGFWYILKIILISLSIALGVVFIIKTAISPTLILDNFVELIVSLVTTIPQAIGWLALVFVLAEHYGGFKVEDLKLDKEWNPSKLAPIPHPKRQIKKSETVIPIIFYMVLMVLFVFSSNFFGIYVFKDNDLSTIVPFLNEASFKSYLPFVLLLLAVFVVKECLKLISGKWTMRLVVYTAIINVISLIVVYFLATGQAFWNPHFLAELVEAGVVSQGSEGYHVAEFIWTNSIRIIVILFVVGLVWDILDGLLKARKK